MNAATLHRIVDDPATDRASPASLSICVPSRISRPASEANTNDDMAR